jgi:hypothetical protein
LRLVTMLTGGSAWPEKATSVDFIRQYTKSLRQKIPVPTWVYDLFDHLEAESSETAFYTDCQTCKWLFFRKALVIVSNFVFPTAALHDIRYYAHAQNMPSNFAALGDAVTRLNPVNGQGMSKALVTALVMDSILRRSPSSLPSTFSTEFFKTSHTKTAFVWNGNKAADYALEACDIAKGETREHGAFMRWYNGQVGKLLVQGDRDVQRRFWQIRHWLAPPTDIFAPSVVAKVLLGAARARFA